MSSKNNILKLVPKNIKKFAKLTVLLFLSTFLLTLIVNTDDVNVKSSPSVIFQDGFESGNFNAWSGTLGSPSVVTAAPHHGTYHLRSNPPAWSEAYAWKDLTSYGYTTLFYRFYFRIGKLPTSGQAIQIGKMQNSGWRDVWEMRIVNSGGTLRLGLRRRFPSDVTTYYNFNFQTNQYYCIEVKFVKASAPNGEYRVYLDGIEVITNTGLDTSGAGTVGIFYAGCYTEYANPNVYVDCVVIADTYIGLESEQYQVSLSSQQDNEETTNKGKIKIDATEYALPNITMLFNRSYTITYIAEGGYEFKQWTTTGDISVTNLTSNPTNLTVSGNGTLKAIYKTATPKLYKISINSQQHEDYGLSYPVTYVFQIPSGSSNLKAYRRYTTTDEWSQLEEKTSNDFFNGIECVKFDYINSKAYVSVAFSNTSDDIYIKITDKNGNLVYVSFLETAKYYDNRKAAVVATADDWEGTHHDAYMAACDAFQSRNIWITMGIITESYEGGPPPNWNDIQTQLNEGYIEAASHSQTHPHAPYSNYDSEIGGSKNDIIGNLTLPPLYRKGDTEYIWCWVEPYGESDSTIRQKLGQYKYLIDRSIGNDENDFASWDTTNGLFQRYGTTTCADWYSDPEGLNDIFDSVYDASKIYHFYFHPKWYDWNGPNIITQHLEYIKNKTNIWYVGFGALYQYHYVALLLEWDELKVSQESTIVQNNAPTIGQFQAPSIAYANRYFFLNATVNDPDGKADLIHATVELSNGIILKWDNNTDAFTKLSDPNNYCVLDSASSFKTQLNETAYKLSWKIKITWAYPEGPTSILPTNTKVLDNQGASSSGNYADLFYFEDDLIVYSASVDDLRINPLQPIAFTGTLYYEGTTTPPEDVSGITVKVNLGDTLKGSTTAINANGTFTISITGEQNVAQYSYTVCATTDENTVQNQTISVIVERVQVQSYTVSDERVNVNDSVYIDVLLHYEYDGNPVTDGSVTINGITATHQGNGVWRITQSKSTVQTVTYDTVAASENIHGITAVDQNGKSATVIWDKIKTTEGGVTKETLTLDETVTIWFKAIYEYDGEPFTGDNGVLYLNGTQMTWSPTNMRWEYTYTADTLGTTTFKISAVFDISYNLTTIEDSAGAKTITVWSMPFSIISNSIITELYFNSTGKTIAFKISGQDGTTGYINITIAKTLIEDVSELKIYFDNEPINYTLASTNNFWLIHFTYQHSTHSVIIKLGSLLSIEPDYTYANPLTIHDVSIITFTIFAVIIICEIKQNCKRIKRP